MKKVWIIEDNEDIVSTLKQIAQEHNIDFGIIQGGSGKLKEFNLVLTKQKGRMEPVQHNTAAYTLDNAHGKIEKTKEGYNCLINATVLDEKLTPKTGQLIKGKASGELRIIIRKADMKKIIIG